MASSPLYIVAGMLARLERGICRSRRALLRGLPGSQTKFPIDAAAWDRLYGGSVVPVRKIASPVTRVLEQLSERGEVLLEAGCGNARMSAELATAGRVVELIDFSQAILDRAVKLFEISKLPPPKTRLADLTQPLGIPDRTVDLTWSSGVLEHWTDAELIPIVREMARISRRRVVSLVPYAGNVFYRWGKWAAESNGQWPYGRELPRQSLRNVFEQVGLHRVSESTIWPEQGVKFLEFVAPELYPEALTWWKSLAPEDPLRQQQGYLLLTVGDVV